MNAPDFTPALARAHSVHLDRQHHAAEARENRLVEIRDTLIRAWLRSNGELIPTFLGESETLAQIVSEQCYDHPDSPLPGMLLVVSAAAQGIDASECAKALIARFAIEHAKRVTA